VYCPDVSIITEDKVMVGIDYDHCKGCGVCVNECKFGALKMITESEAKEVFGE
jgi:pyruvate ferredoxin oxidoreductase delta subunit